MMNIFGGLWVKVAAAFAAIIGLLVVRGKLQSVKIDNLESENKTLTKKSELTEEDSVIKARAAADEQEQVLAIVKEVNSSEEITLNSINNL